MILKTRLWSLPSPSHLTSLKPTKQIFKMQKTFEKLKGAGGRGGGVNEFCMNVLVRVYAFVFVYVVHHSYVFMCGCCP